MPAIVVVVRRLRRRGDDGSVVTARLFGVVVVAEDNDLASCPTAVANHHIVLFLELEGVHARILLALRRCHV